MAIVEKMMIIITTKRWFEFMNMDCNLKKPCMTNNVKVVVFKGSMAQQFPEFRSDGQIFPNKQSILKYIALLKIAEVH